LSRKGSLGDSSAIVGDTEDRSCGHAQNTGGTNKVLDTMVAAIVEDVPKASHMTLAASH
tara:strand:- start:137 stop:313 length:177 start_codon:yes stop_codon:yes gene_type:complete